MRTGLLYLLLVFSVTCYAQDTVVVPRHGSGGIFTSCYGIVFDDGGDSNYTDTTNGYITLAPNWSTGISLYFEEFHFEPVFDYLRIYDGPGTGFPLIGEYSGTSLQGQTVSATGPYITLQQVTDDVMTYSGFKASWTCVLGNEEPASSYFRIFPNPVNNWFNLEIIGADGPAKVDISDAAGRIVLTQWIVLPTAKISLTTLPQGVYFVTLSRPDNGPIYTRKIIKI